MRKPIKRKNIVTVDEAPAELQCYSPELAADILGISMSTVWARLADGSIKSFKLGRSRRILRTTIEALVRYSR